MEKEFKIGLVGPSRIGKTTLISSILDSSQDLLRGEKANITFNDSATKSKISEFRNERAGFLSVGEFNPGGLSSTQNKFIYSLKMNSTDSDEAKIVISFLDFPGGWIKNDVEKWEKECQPFLSESHILMLPIDATVIMEANTNKTKALVPGLLSISEVTEIASEWAKSRAQMFSDDKALLLLLPVKCESYFNDNGGLKDKSAELQSKVRKLYGGLIEVVSGEFKDCIENLEVIYSPIDTYGCVEVCDTMWSDNNFEAEYKLRTPNKLNQKGADTMLLAISKLIVNLASEKQSSIVEEYSKKASEDKGFFGNIWLALSGERKRRKENLKIESDALDKYKEIFKTIAVLSEKNFNPRVEKIGI